MVGTAYKKIQDTLYTGRKAHDLMKNVKIFRSFSPKNVVLFSLGGWTYVIDCTEHPVRFQLRIKQLVEYHRSRLCCCFTIKKNG